MKDFTHPKFPTIHIKLLTNSEDFDKLAILLANNKNSAQDLIDFVPNTSSVDSKYLYGIFDESKLVGVIDLIEDYPAKQVAYIHEFFIDKKYDDDSLAETLYLALEKTAQEIGITSFEIDPTLAHLSLWKNVEFSDNKKNI